MMNRMRVYVLVAIGALALAQTAPAQVPAPTPVWIDTDPAVGVPDRDVDDGFALLQAFHSPELDVRGVSVVFGNAPLAQAWPIGRDMVKRFGPKGLAVYRGAAGASQLGVETPASRALAAALRRSPLVVLVLGPATNVATVLKNHPELASRIVRIVAVAGRRPGQRFTTGTINHAGHRDFNFEQDAEAFRILLDSPVPISLAPFEISSKIWMTGDDLVQLTQGSPGARWMVGPARRWLELWKRTFGVDGFNPFDTLAIARVATPSLLTCEASSARVDVGPDDVTEVRMQGTAPAQKPYLLASSDFGSARPIEYCSSAAPEFKADLLRRLAGDGRQP